MKKSRAQSTAFFDAADRALRAPLIMGQPRIEPLVIQSGTE